MKNTSSQTSTNDQKKTEVDRIVDNQIAFEHEIGRAQIKQKQLGQDVFVEVTDELFDYLTPDAKTPFIMYKNIKVIRKGEQDKVETLMKGKDGI